MLQGERSGLRLAVVIPAWNESGDVASTIESIPRQFPGISDVRIIVVDDGSTDATAEAASSAGSDRVVVHSKHRGLAQAWSTGIAAALRDGAQVIAHTDADGQYVSEDLSRLLAPVLSGDADIVVGARPISSISHFSRSKRALQLLGSRIVSLAAGVPVSDAPSGFRAMTAQAARALNVYGNYTYTLETLIQAGRTGLTVISVPVRVMAPTRPSRLVRSVPNYVWRSMTTIVRIAVLYRPFRFFAFAGAVLLAAAAGVVIAEVGATRSGGQPEHERSLFLATLLAVVGAQAFLTAFLADAMAANRKLSERILAASTPEEPSLDAANAAAEEDRR